MKVLKTPKLEWSAVVTCKKCTAELEVEIADVKPRGNPTHYYVLCPVCFAHFIFEKDSLPWFVERDADKRKPAPFPER